MKVQVVNLGGRIGKMDLICQGCAKYKDNKCTNSELCLRYYDFTPIIKESSIKDIALEISDLVEKKNRDYGNSFDRTIEEYGDVAYFLRIEDKLSRLKSLTNKEAEVDESIEDTLKDIIGYTLLMINKKRCKK